VRSRRIYLLAAAAALAVAVALGWHAARRSILLFDSRSQQTGGLEAGDPIDERLLAEEARLGGIDRQLSVWRNATRLRLERGRSLLRLAELRRAQAWLGPELTPELGLSPQLLEQSRREFLTVIEQAPVEPQAYLGLALLVLAEAEDPRSDSERALEGDGLVELAVSLVPWVPPVRYQAGRYYLGRGRPDTALEHLTAAVTVSSTFSEPVFQLLARYQVFPSRLGPVVPGNSKFWLLQGRAWVAEGNREEARAALTLAAGLDPASTDAFLTLADLLWWEHGIVELDSLVSRYEGAAGPDADRAEVHLQRARIAHLQGDGEAARAEARLALEEEGRSVRVTDQAAWLLWRNGSADEAIDHWSGLLRQAKHDRRAARLAASIHRQIGIALEGQQRYVDALRHYRLALRQDPNDETAARRLAALTGESATR
jgi:tetratricopeptide (TPR) repeat protein